MKICPKCTLPKEESEFHNDNSTEDKLCRICKTCYSIQRKNWRLRTLEERKKVVKKYYQKNIDKLRKEKREYNKNHTEEKSLYDIKYREENKQKIATYKKEWEKEHKNDPIFKIKRNLRRRVHKVLKNMRKAGKTFELIGCTPEFFKSYIENQFTPEMTWKNYGSYWHIDHIKPCCTFDLSIIEEQKECFHYTNQRPLYYLDNLKRKKYE